MPLIIKVTLISISIVSVAACGTKPGDLDFKPGDFSKRHLLAEEYVAEIDSLRFNLAAGAVQEADTDTLELVCIPVAERAKKLSEETGWEIGQVAIKYRNPAHRLDEQAEIVIKRFEELPELQNVWERIDYEEAPGWRYFYPIRIETTCLTCHGDQESRPDFIRDKYPEDTAFDFQVGDLQGLYSVFVPDSSFVH